MINWISHTINKYEHTVHTCSCMCITKYMYIIYTSPWCFAILWCVIDDYNKYEDKKTTGKKKVDYV